MSKLIIICALALGAWCVWPSSVKAGDHKVLIDPRIKSYVVDWCWAMEQAGIPWESKFSELNSILVEFYSDGSKETGNHWRYSKKITINGNYLDRNPCAVRSTVFHEMGHAVFGLQHDCCSIMRTYAYPKEQTYCDNWDLFLKEYLVQCKKAAYE